jgi:trk system potassium uptake protein TrkA
MKIIVAGDGKVGNLLTEQLAKEGHDIVVIDRDPSVLRYSQEKLDLAIVVGNCASSAVQTEAGIQTADLMIAVTSSDEVNLLSALVARKLGCSHLVARVRNQEYDREMNMLKRDFGLSFTINPEKSAANEIFRLIQFPSFLKRNSFAGGRAEMVEFKVTRETGLAGKAT